MHLCRRLLPVLALATPLVGGCAWFGKPYANDPLLRKHQGVKGNPFASEAGDPPPRPCPPAPPCED